MLLDQKRGAQLHISHFLYSQFYTSCFATYSLRQSAKTLSSSFQSTACCSVLAANSSNTEETLWLSPLPTAVFLYQNLVFVEGEKNAGAGNVVIKDQCSPHCHWLMHQGKTTPGHHRDPSDT